MKNAILIAMEFHSMLPVFENPAFTEGYEGFSHLEGIQGHEEQASLHYIIRDHDMEKFEAKKRASKRSRTISTTNTVRGRLSST